LALVRAFFSDLGQGHFEDRTLASKWPTAFQRFKNQPAGGNHNQS